MEESGNIRQAEEILGHQFKNPSLLETALTHSSWANEMNLGDRHNERLEFLGDAALELCVSTELYLRFPTAREGALTKMRAHLVSGASLFELAKEIGLDRLLRLGVGEEKQGGRDRPSVISDTLEAALGAVYEDGGFEAVRLCVEKIFSGHWPVRIEDTCALDNKSRLQTICQHLYHAVPIYALVGSHGAEHAKIYETSVRLPDGRVFNASNTSCKKAEQDAAALALATLDNEAC